MIRYKTYSAIRPVSAEVIADAFSEAEDKELLFVVPEFSKAQIEREILAYKESRSEGSVVINTGSVSHTLSSSLISGDVLSFRKLASNILDDLGTNYLAEGGEIMLRNAIYNILANNKNDLKAFGALSSRIDYINMIIALLGDFSRYGVGVADIDKAISALDNTTSSPAFIFKLKDLRLIMSKLEKINADYGLNLLREPIALACDRLSEIIPGKLNSRRSSGLNALIRSKIVFIGFGSTRMLTPKEKRLVYLLSELGCEIEFNILVNKQGSEYSAVYDTGREFKTSLDDMGASGTELTLNDNDDVLAKIVRAFASDDLYDGISSQGKVRLSEFASVDDRIGYIFNEIIDLTRNQGYRYRDIRIVCCNEEITARMRSTAEIYGLDIFIDRKIALGGTVVPYMMQILLELPGTNYSLDLIMKAMRSGLLSIPPYIADSFENYCYAQNITDAVRLFDENAYIDPKDPNGNSLRRIWIIKDTVPGYEEGFAKDCGKFFYDYVVKRSLMPLRNACNAIFEEKTLTGKARLSLDYLEKIREFIEPLRDELIERGDNSSAVALVRGYDELVSLLMCSTHEMNNCEISQKEFLTMIRTDMRNRTEGTIPLKVDSIEITTPEHAFVTPCKVLFIIGAQKDNFPYVRMREGLLSGVELKALSGAADSIDLPDKTLNKMREEFVISCLILGSSTDRLYMVHEYGVPKSRVFEYLEHYTDQEFHSVNTFKNPIAGNTVKFRHDFEKAKIPEDIMSRLLTVRKDNEEKKCIFASVSSIESFRKCAFQFMLERYLRINPREDNTKIRTNSFGSMIHDMFESAYKDLRDNSGGDPEKFGMLAEELLSNEEKYNAFADKCLKKAVSSRALFGSCDEEGNPKDRFFEMDTYAKLRRMFTKMFRDVLGESVKTGYVPQGVEADIGKKEGAIELKIPYSGIELEFSGKIDRYDVRSNGDGILHVRTIDYKSGDKVVDTIELLNGTQIQLPAYSGAVLDMCKKDGTDAQIDDYGYVLVGLKTKIDDEPLSCVPQLSGYNAQAMEIAIKYSKHIIRESVDQIASGKSDAVTATNKIDLCRYCDFRSYCGNNPSKSRGREQIDLSSHSKYGIIVERIDKYVKGAVKKHPGFDGITMAIGGDTAMPKEDRRAFLAMNDVLMDSEEEQDGED